MLRAFFSICFYRFSGFCFVVFALSKASFAFGTDSTSIGPLTEKPKKYCCINYVDYQVGPNTYMGSSPYTVTARYVIADKNQTVNNPAYSMHSSGYSGYDESRTVFNCPPGSVAVSLVGMQDNTITLTDDSEGATGGILCANVSTYCQWVDADEKKLSKRVNFTYYAPKHGYWQNTTYTASGDCT